MLGRRGPAQAAFTPPELKELGELAGADVIVDPADLELDPASETALEDGSRARAAQRRAAARVRRAAARGQAEDGSCLRFLVSPVAILGDGPRRGGRGRPQPARSTTRGRDRRRADGRDARRSRAGIVFRSVGYRGVRASRACRSTSGAATIPNDRGRVEGAPGVYVAGWIKRGPSGVIGTNKKDATETVELLLEDARAGRLPLGEGSLEDLLAERGAEPVVYAGWEAIDASERARGEPLGRPRVKLATWPELLEQARALEAREAARRSGARGAATRDCGKRRVHAAKPRAATCSSAARQRLADASTDTSQQPVAEARASRRHGSAPDRRGG